MTGVCYNNIVPETKSRNKMRYSLLEIIFALSMFNFTRYL